MVLGGADFVEGFLAGPKLFVIVSSRKFLFSFVIISGGTFLSPCALFVFGIC